jgi:hypothetical protein
MEVVTTEKLLLEGFEGRLRQSVELAGQQYRDKKQKIILRRLLS